MMDGIQALMPQGQPQMPGQAPMPGQAAMPGMQPGRGGPPPGINPQTPMLEKLNLDQLKQLYMQSMLPGSSAPVQPYAILSAISKKAQEAKMMQALQNASAQQQNAYQQGIGSIAEQVLQQADDAQEPVMARHGGELHGYAGGGIVAFAEGDAVWRKRLLAAGVPESFIAELEARKAGPEQIESDARRAGYMGAKPAGVESQRTPTSFETINFARVDEDAAPPAPAPVEASGIAQAPGAAVGIEPSGIAQNFEEPPTPPIPIAPAKPELPTELKAAYERRIANAAMSPEQLRLLEQKQAEEMKTRRSILEAAEKRAGAAETRAKEDYETEKAGIPQMYGPEFFFQLAGDISTKRGEELGSAGKSVARFMAEQRKAQTAARKDYRTAQDAADRMRTASETIRLATAERDAAIAKNQIDIARAAQDKIDQAGLEYEKAKYEREQSAIKVALEERKTDALEKRAEAAATSAAAAERRAAAYENRPEPTSDLNRAYQIEYEALKADGAPDTPATRRKAMDLAMDKLSRGAAGLRARTGQLTAANKEFVERAMSDPSLRGLRGQDRIDALDRLRGKVEEKYGVAPDAPDPTPSSAAPTAKPAPAAAATTPPAAAVPPIAMPAKESELKDGVVYETKRGPARWDAKQKQFFSVQ